MTSAHGGAPVATNDEGTHTDKNQSDSTAASGSDLDVARQLAAAGFPVFVAKPARDETGTWDPNGGKGGTGYWLPTRWQATPADPSTLDTYEPGDALGLVCGHGIDALDFDPRSGGEDSHAQLAGAGLVPTVIGEAATPSGGSHLLVNSLGVRSRDGVLPGFDVKAGTDEVGHGFVFIAPTVKRSKVTGQIGAYLWTTEPNLDELDLGDRSGAALAGVIDSVRAPRTTLAAPTTDAPATEDDLDDAERDRRRRYFASAVAAEVARLDAMAAAKTPNGAGYTGERWDATVYAVACALLEIANTPGGGLTADEAAQLVREHAPRDAGFDDARVEAKIDSARRTVGTKKRTIPARPVDPFGDPTTGTSTTGTSGTAVASAVEDDDEPLPGFGWTDVAVAEDFARSYTDRLKHSAALGWLEYTGGRWRAVPDKRATTFALWHAKKRARAALGAGSDELKAATKRLEARALAAVVKIAAGLPGISVDIDELDADPYLLNCTNGTLDLRTREMRPHDPADLLTKITAAAYRPDADRRVWEEFLASSLPDAEERAYLARVIGQALVGRVFEHLFPVLTGAGGNGKGTFYTAIEGAGGDYVISVDPALLMSTETGKAGGPEMMRLRGARLAFASETNEGRKLDEALMKRLTGGDPIEARHLYREPVEWLPTHQLFYVTNYLPKVKGNDPAVWRRMRVVPFDVVIPEAQRDTSLSQTLELHREAVLAWAVEGYADYTAGGMREPATRTTPASHAVGGAADTVYISTRGSAMTVETLTRQQAEAERDHLAHDLAEEHGTADREELRDISLSGALTFEQIARIERLEGLDYLLGE